MATLQIWVRDETLGSRIFSIRWLRFRARRARAVSASLVGRRRFSLRKRGVLDWRGCRLAGTLRWRHGPRWICAVAGGGPCNVFRREHSCKTVLDRRLLGWPRQLVARAEMNRRSICGRGQVWGWVVDIDRSDRRRLRIGSRGRSPRIRRAGHAREDLKLEDSERD